MPNATLVTTKKTILVADDNQGILDVMKLLLGHVGYIVSTSLDGTGVQNLMKPLPDLIFLDLLMSGYDGRDLCRNLKADIQTKDIPVIILSANTDIEKIAMACGANSFLAKPFQMKVMLEKVREMIA